MINDNAYIILFVVGSFVIFLLFLNMYIKRVVKEEINMVEKKKRKKYLERKKKEEEEYMRQKQEQEQQQGQQAKENPHDKTCF